MFWGMWPEINIVDEKVFDLYFDPNDGKYDHDRKENHKHHQENNTYTQKAIVGHSNEKKTTIPHANNEEAQPGPHNQY